MKNNTVSIHTARVRGLSMYTYYVWSMPIVNSKMLKYKYILETNTCILCWFKQKYVIYIELWQTTGTVGKILNNKYLNATSGFGIIIKIGLFLIVCLFLFYPVFLFDLRM